MKRKRFCEAQIIEILKHGAGPKPAGLCRLRGGRRAIGTRAPLADGSRISRQDCSCIVFEERRDALINGRCHGWRSRLGTEFGQSTAEET